MNTDIAIVLLQHLQFPSYLDTSSILKLSKASSLFFKLLYKFISNSFVFKVVIPTREKFRRYQPLMIAVKEKANTTGIT